MLMRQANNTQIYIMKKPTENLEWQHTSVDDILYHTETDRFAFFNPLTNEIDVVGFLDDCKLASALFFFRCEKELCIDEFNADLCLEDIHRIYGIETCNAVKQSINL